MIVNQNIIANMLGLRVENVVCFQPILQFNKFHGYETHSTYSQKPRISLKNPLRLFPEDLIAGCLSLKQGSENMICFIHE